MTIITDKPAQNAYLRDGALILYFDMAETPFISRFDLDSLAQANFEVTDKKDGNYSLVLRDYTGQEQTIGQFNSKADAHNALYAILKALLSQNDKAGKTCATKTCALWCFVKGVLKFLLALILLLIILYGYMWLKLPARNSAPNSSAVQQSSMVKPPIANLPQGEAVDADDFLKQAAPPAPIDTTPKE